jgi:hypothetical protein
LSGEKNKIKESTPVLEPKGAETGLSQIILPKEMAKTPLRVSF